MRGTTGIIVVMLGAVVVAHVETQPADELGQLGVSRYGALLELFRCRLGQPLHHLPMPNGTVQGELRTEHVTLLPDVNDHAFAVTKG